MTNRREFIQSGLAFSSLSLAEFSSLKMAVASPDGALLALESFVADRRYTESLAAAQELGSQGVPVVEISGDLTELWYEDYSLRWKQNPMTLAGVTGEDVLFVLETLAPEHGMRVVYRQELRSLTAQTNSDDEKLYSWIITSKKITNTVST